MCKYCDKGISTLFEDKYTKVKIVNNGSSVYCEIENTRYFEDGFTSTGNDFFDIEYCPICGRKLISMR